MPSSASIRSLRLLLIVFFAFASLYYIARPYSIRASTDGASLRGLKEPGTQIAVHDITHQESDVQTSSTGKLRQTGRAKAAFVTLVRNEELWEIVKSIRRVEDRFNRNYHYPWVFLNDVPFTKEFIETTSKMASGETSYGMTLPLIRKLADSIRTCSEGTLVCAFLD
jgi:alpha 1,2-mannosyltransferase